MEDKKNLINLLFQLTDYSKKIQEIVSEIDIITKRMCEPSLNFESYIEQINNLINSMKSDVKKYYTRLRYNKITIPIDNDLKIYIGFRQPSGEVHTFEARYGTTVDKLISTYLKVINKNRIQNDIFFEYNNKKLKLGDMNLIENIFSDEQNPTVFVKNFDNTNEQNRPNNEFYYDF